MYTEISQNLFFIFQGKHIGRLSHQDPGEFPEEVKTLFEKAVQYYEQNMTLMVEIGDRAAQGRACGNLGNVHYLLGNFSRAIHFHQERLKIAREFGDRAAGMSKQQQFFYILLYNLDLVTPNLVTNRDLVTNLQKTIFSVHKNISFSDNWVFSVTSI